MGCVTCLGLCGCCRVSQHRRRAGLVRMWRTGELVEVIYRRAWKLNAYAYCCTVEYAGRTARVILANDCEDGARLAALIEGSWIAVQDVVGGRLRIGHLAERT